MTKQWKLFLYFGESRVILHWPSEAQTHEEVLTECREWLNASGPDVEFHGNRLIRRSGVMWVEAYGG